MRWYQCLDALPFGPPRDQGRDPDPISNPPSLVRSRRMHPGEIPSPAGRSDYFSSIKFRIVVGHRPRHTTGTCVRCTSMCVGSRHSHREASIGSAAASRWVDQAPPSRETLKDHLHLFQHLFCIRMGVNVRKISELNLMYINKYRICEYDAGILLFLSTV